MELRHLRFFVAVAEAGSLTEAAGKRLHTAQPSLGRQMRDLEYEVGVTLMIRGARGIELTPSGRAFLDHARLALAQVEAAGEAARRAAQRIRPTFALGFLTGQEVDWMQPALRVLRDELPNTDVTVSSQYSPDLADALRRGKLDVAFMRREKDSSDLDYRLLISDPLMAAMPSDHRLAALGAVSIEEIARESFIHMSKTAPVLRELINDYLKRSHVSITPSHEVD